MIAQISPGWTHPEIFCRIKSSPFELLIENEIFSNVSVSLLAFLFFCFDFLSSTKNWKHNMDNDVTTTRPTHTIHIISPSLSIHSYFESGKSYQKVAVRVYNGTCISSLLVSRLATFFNSSKILFLETAL